MRACVIALTATMGLCGCVSSGDSVKSFKDGSVSSGNVRTLTYSLPRTLLEIRGGPCIAQPAEVTCDPDDDDAPYGIVIVPVSKADPSETYTAALSPATWSKEDFDISVNAEGLLTSTNAQSSDATRQAIIDSTAALAMAFHLGSPTGGSLISQQYGTSGIEDKLRDLLGSFKGEKPVPVVLGAFSTSCWAEAVESGRCTAKAPIRGRTTRREKKAISRAAPDGSIAGSKTETFQTYEIGPTGNDFAQVCAQRVVSEIETKEKVLIEKVSTLTTCRYAVENLPREITFTQADAPSPSFSCKVNPTTPGLIYRMPYTALIEVSANQSGSSTSLAKLPVTLVNSKQTSCVDIRRRGFTDTTTTLTFSNGMLTTYDALYPSPGGQIASLPKDAIGTALMAVGNLLTARVTIRSEQVNLMKTETEILDELKKRVEAEDELKKKIQEINAADQSTN